MKYYLNKQGWFIALGIFLGHCLFAQGTTSWSKKNNFPAGALSKGISFTIGDKGYAGLGRDNLHFKKDFWQYDPKKDKWEPLESFPGQERISSVSFSIDIKGYVGTGMIGPESNQAGTNDFWEYDTKKNVWTQKASLPGDIRYGAVGFSLRDKGYIALGANKNVYYNDLWEYDPVSNRWTRKAEFPTQGRADASVFIIKEEAYVLLGQKKELIPSQKDCWKYSPIKNEWKKAADFPSWPRIGALAFSYRSKGYISCGFNGVMKRFSDFWEYDSSTDTWLKKEDVPFGAKSYIFSFTIDSSAYVCTGNTQKNSTGFEVWKCDFHLKEKNVKKFVLGGTLLLGENRMPLSYVLVKLLNDKGEIVKKDSTGHFGSFLFINVPDDNGYILSIEVTDSLWKKESIYLVSKNNEAIAMLNNSNEFKFPLDFKENHKLQFLKIESKGLRMDMSGKLVLDNESKLPLANTEISLINSQEQIVQTTRTNQNGNFVFKYLSVDSTLYLSINKKENLSLPAGTRILLLNATDSIVEKSTADMSRFRLVNLPPEQNSLTQLYVEDPWLQAMYNVVKDGLLFTEVIYFEYAKWDILPAAKAVLNKVVKTMTNNKKISFEISAHTDSRGDEKFNLSLSEKRANEAKIYITSQGVDGKRIATKGLGESNLINPCRNEVACTEEEHAKNRRMEFKVQSK